MAGVRRRVRSLGKYSTRAHEARRGGGGLYTTKPLGTEYNWHQGGPLDRFQNERQTASTHHRRSMRRKTRRAPQIDKKRATRDTSQNHGTKKALPNITRLRKRSPHPLCPAPFHPAPPPHMPASYRNCGICVDLPLPVSPTTTTVCTNQRGARRTTHSNASRQ